MSASYHDNAILHRRCRCQLRFLGLSGVVSTVLTMTTVLPRGSRTTNKIPRQPAAPTTDDTAVNDTAVNDAEIDDAEIEMVLDGVLLPEAPVSPAGPMRPTRTPQTTRPESSTDDARPQGRLTERQKAMLAFEKSWWRRAGSKEQAIKEQFKLSATRYYQLLNQLLELPEALAYDPLVVGRLRRLRATRARSRRAT